MVIFRCLIPYRFFDIESFQKESWDKGKITCGTKVEATRIASEKKELSCLPFDIRLGTCIQKMGSDTHLSNHPCASVQCFVRFVRDSRLSLARSYDRLAFYQVICQQ